VSARTKLRRGVAIGVFLIAACLPAPALARAEEEDKCASAANPVACENALPGTPMSVWQVNGVGSESIQGFATAMSVNVGETERFKIETNASSYHIDILRLGYYKGDGARMVATSIPISAKLPQKQPECLKYSSTGLIDCGNWEVSASWSVPSTAVSGVYIALLEEGNGNASQIPFVVRNDASHSEILLQTSDATWEAYNDWGGNSLYTCTVSCPPGEPEGYKAAYEVSYNRPWEGSFEVDGGASYLWYAEYQMIYWLEEQGYNVSYTSESSIAESGAQIKNHKLFVSSGHDEYWSGSQREHVESALAAGVNLAFFSGNEIFWKTRWAPSTEGASVPNRTLTTYKETHFNSPVDPDDPPTWTGSWRDPRFSPPADGGKPENALTGQDFLINAGTADITVPYAYSKLRMWRHTGAEKLSSGQSLTLAPGSGTLGYEWDEDVDNGFRPAGEFDLSSTTVSGLQAFTDYGTHVAEGASATHHLTLYRAPSGALVFGAGTVQWSWGLANVNVWESETTEPGNKPPDPNVEQATVNLLAEMGAQPGTLTSGLIAASPSTNTTPPTSTIQSPSQNATLSDGSNVTISGSATASGGGVVAGVEVSTDGGVTWHPATLSGPAEQSVKWTYAWAAHGYPATKIESRAVDDSGNLEHPGAGVSVSVSCPCSIWGAGITPPTTDSGDPSSLELGVKFTSSMYGTLTGVRFYKSPLNIGTHVGSLWTAEGKLLAQATFEHETQSGWQQVSFAEPVAIEAGVTYVVSYLAPDGHYADIPYYFYDPPAVGGNVLNSPPLHAVQANATTVNGLYAYTSAPSFPTGTFDATNYWVDPVFEPATVPGRVGGVHATPNAGAATVSWSAPSGVVSKYTITPYIGTAAQSATVLTGSPPATGTTISNLTPGTTYTFTVQASNPNGAGPVSEPSNAVTPPATAPPAPPIGVSGTPATRQAQVSWQAPVNEGGTPITEYKITPYLGSVAQTPLSVTASARNAILTGLRNGSPYTFRVAASNEIGEGEPSAASTAITPQDTIFDFSTPALVDAGDPSAVELGVKFTVSVEGLASGIRFYKAAANTGTHVGTLWSAEGTQLATATFTHETPSGWQQVSFSEPVPLKPGVTYVAGYFAPNGHYSANSAAFAYAGAQHRPLQTLANSTSADGLYSYSPVATFPTHSFNATNYWVDVMFAPTQTTGPPSPPVEVDATVASGHALVSWGEPSGEGGAQISGYTVTPYIGSTPQTPTKVSGSSTSATIGGLTNGTSYTFKVTASNEIGESEASKPSGAVTPADTIFEFATPSTIDSGDSAPIELGVHFKPEGNGQITGIRFYKAAANIGTHIGSLWNAEGKLLASATFTGETLSGWQQVSFSEPVQVKAGTTYLAGYYAPNGHYSASSDAFSSGPVTNPPLQAPSDLTVSNGLYSYSSTSVLPESSFNATNYWVDVMFLPASAAAPEAPEAVAAAAASKQVEVSWKAPGSSAGPITSYKITPYVGSTAQSPLTASGSASSLIVGGLTNGTAYTFKVSASNERGEGEASAASNAVVPQDTIFELATPAVVDSGDASAIELGVKLTSEVAGQITGIRFYKAAANTGTHTVSLWNAEGALLATATPARESQSGWEQATFTQPVQVQAGATYVAGYYAPNGHYSANSAQLTSAGVSNPPLLALSNQASSNGLYLYSSLSIFPTASFNATNYWVDVLFTPSP
jgi:hypothetical protein